MPPFTITKINEDKSIECSYNGKIITLVVELAYLEPLEVGDQLFHIEHGFFDIYDAQGIMKGGLRRIQVKTNI